MYEELTNRLCGQIVSRKIIFDLYCLFAPFEFKWYTGGDTICKRENIYFIVPESVQSIDGTTHHGLGPESRFGHKKSIIVTNGYFFNLRLTLISVFLFSSYHRGDCWFLQPDLLLTVVSLRFSPP